MPSANESSVWHWTASRRGADRRAYGMAGRPLKWSSTGDRRGNGGGYPRLADPPFTGGSARPCPDRPCSSSTAPRTSGCTTGRQVDPAVGLAVAVDPDDPRQARVEEGCRRGSRTPRWSNSRERTPSRTPSARSSESPVSGRTAPSPPGRAWMSHGDRSPTQVHARTSAQRLRADHGQQLQLVVAFGARDGGVDE
jgi:hypothetical protein